MARIFMSVVGMGKYQPVDYKLGDQNNKNRFVQKSLLSMLKEQGVKYDRIIFFLTKEAKESNWERYLRSKDNVTIEDEGLKPFLEKHFKSLYEPIEIASGEKEEELLGMFQTIYNEIGEGDQITFDITHGFRLMPLLFYPVMSYAKELKNISIEHIYYGMYDHNKSDAPIVELKQYDQILDWANAAHNFIHFGNAGEIAKLMKERYEELKGDEKRTLCAQKNLAEALEKFTDALLTCRGESIKECAEECSRKLAKVNDGSDDPLFYELIMHAIASICDFQGNKTPYEIGMETVRWCKEKGLVQQAYTALKETIITFCCEIYAAEIKNAYLDYDVRDNAVNKALGAFSAHNAKNEDHLKNLKRLNNAPELQKVYMRIYTHVNAQSIEFISQLSDTRNHLNHFGMKSDKLSADKIKNRLQADYKSAIDFINDIEARKSEILDDEQLEQELHKLCCADRHNFINFSNHPSERWSEEQKQAALQMTQDGELIDVSFPAVPAHADEDDIKKLAEKYEAMILAHKPAAVMCQGEFGLCYALICKLKEKSIRVVYSCTERSAVEKITENGVEKISVFRFVKFREY